MQSMQNFLSRPQQEGKPDDVPLWMKYAGRGLGAGGGILAIALGAWTCVTIFPICIVAGIWQMLAGFVVVVIEAPCCCVFVDSVQNLSNWMDSRPHWQRGLFYILISLPAFILCIGLSTLFGSGLIFATGIIYGMMSLGKKASREEMRANLERGDVYGSKLVDNLKDPGADAAPVGSLPPPSGYPPTISSTATYPSPAFSSPFPPAEPFPPAAAAPPSDAPPAYYPNFTKPVY